MNRRGIDRTSVLKLLKDKRARDLKYSEGRILGSMCTSPHPVAKEAFIDFLETNLGDSGLFPGTKELETDAVRLMGSLLGKETAAGFIVSGGTEANLMALWAAKVLGNKDNPQVIIPETAHFSFEKSAGILGLELVRARIKSDHTIDISDVSSRIGPHTVALVGIAGSTEYGVIDDIQALSELAVNNDLFLHVDAAFGGFVIPFLEEIGFDSRRFDFSLEGVSSITIDPHKMGLAPVPAGGILFRDSSYMDAIKTQAPYLTEKDQFTITGTRTGASAAAVYAVMNHLGREGYRNVVKECIEHTRYLVEKLKGMGIQPFKCWMNILVFPHKDQDRIAGALKKRGWMISQTRKGEIRLLIMPHLKIEHIDEFISVLKEIISGMADQKGQP